MNRTEIADHVSAKLSEHAALLTQLWRASAPINHFFVDDLLPLALAQRISGAFPPAITMGIKKSLRELKHVAAQMDKYDPILEESLYAFQDPRIVGLIEKITALPKLEPDSMLYAGGISLMSKGHFLNPHIDNSHDKSRERYRVLNLLYYVSPDWTLSNGGNLEVWPDGMKGPQTTIESRFNRLAVMVTHRGSWHSVSPVMVDAPRRCVSNYYFSHQPADGGEYFHVTSFRGRPEQPVRDVVLRADIALRSAVRKVFPKGIVENKHFYDKK